MCLCVWLCTVQKLVYTTEEKTIKVIVTSFISQFLLFSQSCDIDSQFWVTQSELTLTPKRIKKEFVNTRIKMYELRDKVRMEEYKKKSEWWNKKTRIARYAKAIIVTYTCNCEKSQNREIYKSYNFEIYRCISIN